MVSLSVCLSVRLSVRPSVRPSVCLLAGLAPASTRGEGWVKCTDVTLRDQFSQQRTIQKVSRLEQADAIWSNLTVVARLLVCEDDPK